MIQKETNLIPLDSCGVWSVKVFHLYNGSLRKKSTVSNFVKVSVKKVKPENWIPKKTKLKGIIVFVKKESRRIDGGYVKFNYNSLVLLKKRLTPKGIILMGPVDRMVRRKRFLNSFCGSI